MNFQILIRSLLGTFLCIALFSDCRKTDVPSDAPSSFSVSSTFRQLTLNAAKSSFEEQKARLSSSRQDSLSASITDYLASIQLDWDYADTIMYQGSTPILRVPVAGAAYRYHNQSMVFFLNDQGLVDSRLMVVTTDSSYNATTQFSQNFDGYVAQFNWSGEMVHSYRIDDGYLTSSIKSAVTERSLARDCPANQIMIYVNEPTLLFICVEFGTPSSGGGFGFPGNGGGNPVGGGGGGGGVSNDVFSNHINNYFNTNDFEGIAKKNATIVNKLKDRFGLFNSSQATLNNIINDCNLPGEDDSEGLHEALIEYVNGPILPCLQTVIANDRADFFNTMYSINVTTAQIQALSTAGVNINSETFIDFFVTLGLTSVQVQWLINDAQHLKSTHNFFQTHGEEVDAVSFIQSHITQMSTDAEYAAFNKASYSFPNVIWTIGKELASEKAIGIIVNLVPGFNKKDEVRDAIIAATQGDWLSFTWEVGKIIAGQLPAVKVLDAAVEIRQLAVKLDKIYGLITSIGEQALERSWNILKNSTTKFSSNALKYVNDIAYPKFGWATSNDHRSNFRSMFPEEDIPQSVFDNMQVHHAVPQAVLTKYPNLGIMNGHMHSVENLRGIPNDALTASGAKVHTQITNLWTTWYTQHLNATLDEVKDYANFIDNLYGHQFIPPVR